MDKVLLGTNISMREDLLDFKKKLIESVIIRFTTTKPTTGGVKDCNGQTRRMTTYNVTNNKTFVLATVLNPTAILIPFVGKHNL